MTLSTDRVAVVTAGTGMVLMLLTVCGASIALKAL
jgi:hypothetical protein